MARLPSRAPQSPTNPRGFALVRTFLSEGESVEAVGPNNMRYGKTARSWGQAGPDGVASQRH